MEPLTDVRELTHLIYGFKASKAALAGIELGVFDRLADGPKSIEEVEGELALGARRTETLLTALTSIGLLSSDEGRYVNAPVAADHLTSTRSTYLGEYFLNQTDRFIYPAFGELTSVLAGNGTTTAWTEYEQLMADPAAAEEFSRAQHAGSLGPAAALARRIDLEDRRNLVDIGGGSGAFTIALCGRNPDLRCTIVDFEHALGVAASYVAAGDLDERVGFTAGNVLEDQWPGGHDVVLMSFLLSAVAGSALGELFRRSFAALPSGGLLVVHDFMVDDDLSGPTDAALWFLTCMFNCADGRVLTPSLMVDEMSAAGFVDIGVVPLIPDLTSVATALKP